jgi:hypothetical protein
MAPCNGSAPQQWWLSPAGELVGYGFKCLDVRGARTDPGAPVHMWTCHGGANQKWFARSQNYPGYVRAAEGVRDVEWGHGPSGRTLWALGAEHVGRGCPVSYRDGQNGWIRTNGAAVAIEGGAPWIVDEENKMFQWAGWGFYELPGRARDIGVGDYRAYIVGTEPVPGGYQIYEAIGNPWRFEKVPGGAVAITVGVDDRPWIIDDQGSIARFDGTAFVRVPGKAKQISASRDVLIIGDEPAPFGHALYEWDGTAFQKVTDAPGGAVRITTSDYSRALVNSQGWVYVTPPRWP